jgi:hypothetical protein
MAVDVTTPQFGEPYVNGYEASEEEGVRLALDMNVLKVLSATIGGLQPSKEKFITRPLLILSQGIRTLCCWLAATCFSLLR